MTERELFLSALDFEDPTARIEHLRQACAGDTQLLARVEALLASHEAQSRFLNTPVVEQLTDPSSDESAVTILAGSGSTRDSDVDDSGCNVADTLAAQGNDMADEIPLGYLQPSDKPGSLGRLAHYEVEEVLGRGAFGTVLKAFDEKLHRVVAIKVLAPEMASTSPARKRFLREARSSAAVRHENVVAIYAVEDEPIPYLVMEYVPGLTLQQRLNQHGPLSVPDVLRLGKQIADGLAAAHSQGLIHRDIKPGNILLDTSVHDRVKITDFGLARTADDASMTQSGMIAGTPLYMAPEQALGHKLDQRADLFSFGSVLYQMLSGRPPFRAPNTMAVLKRVTEETPRPINEIIPEVPTWMCEIVSHLHAKNPAERYDSAQEVSRVLEQCLEDFKAGRKPKIPAPHRPVADATVRVQPTGKGSLPRQPWRKIAAALLVIAVTLGITEATGVTRLVVQRTESRPAIQEPVAAVNSSTAASPTTAASSSDTAIRSPAAAPPSAIVPLDADQAKQHQQPLPGIAALQPTLRQFASDEWIEVIPLIDPKLDKWNNTLTGSNEWRVEDGELMAGYADVQASKLLLPLDAEWRAFECAIEFTRRAGPGGFNVNIPSSVGDCPAVFNPPNKAGVFLGSRDGGVVLNEETRIVSGTRSTLQLEVRRRPNNDAVSVWFNNAPAGTWTGDVSSIAMKSNEGYPSARRMSLWIHGGGNEIIFHRIRVRMLDGGTAESLRPIASVQPVMVAKQGPSTAFTNSVGMEFVIVPRGKSWLGGGKDKLGDREVEFPADFYLGKYEVTQEEWTRVMMENPSHFARTGGGAGAVRDISDADLRRFPVENVSWDQCRLFVEKLNTLEAETGWVHRLPQQTEWEYACRGGPMADKADSAFDFYFAKPTNNPLREQSIVGRHDGANRTNQVGSTEANRLGLFDMHRNVWEWCEDTDDAAKEEVHRVHVGGGWNNIRWRSAAAIIESDLPSHRSSSLGLRVARVPSGAPLPEAGAAKPASPADARQRSAVAPPESEQ